MKHSKEMDIFVGGRAAGHEFVNNILGNFWDNINLDIPLKLKQDHYYEVNRAIVKAIENNVKFLQVSMTESYDMVKHVGKERLEEMLANKAANMMVKALLEDQDIYITNKKTNNIGDLEYSVTLPVIVTAKSKEPETKV